VQECAAGPIKVAAAARFCDRRDQCLA
jgi:hypothetical protein